MATITLETVIERVDTGVYKRQKVKAVPGGRKISRAFDTFLKIVDNETGVDIKAGNNGFYYCVECKTTLERDITNGTSALLTHQDAHKRQAKPSTSGTSTIIVKSTTKDETLTDDKNDDALSEPSETNESVAKPSTSGVKSTTKDETSTDDALDELVNDQMNRVKAILNSKGPLEQDDFDWFTKWTLSIRRRGCVVENQTVETPKENALKKVQRKKAALKKAPAKKAPARKAPAKLPQSKKKQPPKKTAKNKLANHDEESTDNASEATAQNVTPQDVTPQGVTPQDVEPQGVTSQDVTPQVSAAERPKRPSSSDDGQKYAKRLRSNKN